jgi:hypothetical protein
MPQLVPLQSNLMLIAIYLIKGIVWGSIASFIMYFPNIVDFLFPITNGYYIFNLYYFEIMFNSYHIDNKFMWGCTMYLNNHSPYHVPLGFNYILMDSPLPSCFPSLLLDYSCLEAESSFRLQWYPDYLNYIGERFNRRLIEQGIPIRGIPEGHDLLVSQNKLYTTTIYFATWKYILSASIILALTLIGLDVQLIQPI